MQCKLVSSDCHYPLYGRKCGCTFAEYYGVTYGWMRAGIGALVLGQLGWAVYRVARRPPRPEPPAKRVMFRMACIHGIIMACRIPDPFGWTSRIFALIHTFLSDLSTASAYSMMIVFATVTLHVISQRSRRGTQWLSQRWRQGLTAVLATLLVFTLATAGLKDAWNRSRGTQIQYAGLAGILAVTDAVLTLSALSFLRSSFVALRSVSSGSDSDVTGALRGKLVRISVFIVVVNVLVALTLWMQITSIARFGRIGHHNQLPSATAMRFQVIAFSLQMLAGYVALGVYACECEQLRRTARALAWDPAHGGGGGGSGGGGGPADPLVVGAYVPPGPPVSTLEGYGSAHGRAASFGELEYDVSEMPSSAQEVPHRIGSGRGSAKVGAPIVGRDREWR